MAILVDDPGTLVDDPDVSVNGSILTPPDPGYVPGIYNATAPRTLPTYELVLVERTPNQAAAASYVEVGQILAPTITWTDVLNGDGTIKCSTSTNRLDADIKQALRDCITPDGAPTGLELLLYRDGTPVWRGPLVGGQVQGGTVTLDGRGLGYLLRYMWVVADLTYTAVDQFTIAKGLVDQWQSLDWGHFGIDTSAIGTSGVTRDRTYLADEHPNVREALGQLANVNDGFDWHVDPVTRVLTLAHPQRGADNGVVFDRRNIGDPGVAFSVAAGDVASEGLGTGTSSAEAALASTWTDQTVRETFGRTGVAASFDGVTEQATLDAHTRRLQEERAAPLFVPGPKLIPVTDADVGDLAAGDTVTWEYDAGLGLQTVTRRLLKVQVSVNAEGGEELQVELT